MMMRRTVVSALTTLLAAASLTLSAYAQQSSTAFTYQGFLKDNGQPANGTYDLKFTLYDAATEGDAIGDPVLIEDLQIQNGLFTVEIDFGVSPFAQGERRWLEIGIRSGDSDSDYDTLPRIELTPVPYALYAQKAKDAENAQNAQNAENAQNALRIQNQPVSDIAPQLGQVLRWNGSQWRPGFVGTKVYTKFRGYWYSESTNWVTVDSIPNVVVGPGDYVKLTYTGLYYVDGNRGATSAARFLLNGGQCGVSNEIGDVAGNQVRGHPIISICRPNPGIYNVEFQVRANVRNYGRFELWEGVLIVEVISPQN